MAEVDARALKVARSVARELMAGGARAAVLTGSHARGHAHAESDIDLVVVLPKRPPGDEEDASIRRRGGMLITTSWATATSVRAAFGNPRLAPTVVPGWREAIVVADPNGIAAKLKSAAKAWTWDAIGEDELNDWVAAEITGWAEEVHKIVRALAAGHEFAIATQRSVLALRLAGVIAVHRRLLYGTENIMWDVVADAMGADWRTAQRAALSMDGESLDASARAALRLFALAAAELRHLLNRRQRSVVDHACAIAGWPFG